MRTRIKEFRARYNFTQEDLANLVGVRRETIVFLEKGKYNPSLKLAHDVAKACTPRSTSCSSSTRPRATWWRRDELRRSYLSYQRPNYTFDTRHPHVSHTKG